LYFTFPYHSRSDDNPDVIGRIADDMQQDTHEAKVMSLILGISLNFWPCLVAMGIVLVSWA